jgi:hypothetical protein
MVSLVYVSTHLRPARPLGPGTEERLHLRRTRTSCGRAGRGQEPAEGQNASGATGYTKRRNRWRTGDDAAAATVEDSDVAQHAQRHRWRTRTSGATSYTEVVSPGPTDRGARNQNTHLQLTLCLGVVPAERRGSGGTGRGPGTGEATSYTRRRHWWRTGTQRSGAGRGPGPADIKGTSGRSYEPAAKRTKFGLGEPESTHCWTGTTCRRHSPAPTGVRSGMWDCRGWAGSKTEETRASRVGLGWPANQDVLPLREF